MAAPSAADLPSKSQVTKAGKLLRRALLVDSFDPDDYITVDQWMAAVQILTAFRAAHAVPMRKANMGLRSRLKTETCRVEVSQRLKRIPTILDKLTREPTMALGNMGDIGGCRAVLDSIEEIRRVDARLQRTRPPVQYHDYITTPRPTGYRAVHLIIEYDERRIEVQLRTRVMHEWAVTVERFSGRLGKDIKGGNGPREVVVWFQAISEAMAVEETGGRVDDTMMTRIKLLRAAADPYLAGGRS